MLRIAICDDEIKDLKILKTFTIKLLESLNMNYEIEEFTNGNNLLNSTISFDLLLLDIEMDEINGIEIARTIRINNRDAKIIFITNSQDYLRIGYTVKAEGYFMKPIDEIEFNYELTNLLKDEILDNKFISDKRLGTSKIYINEIIYIEYFDRKTIIHKKNEKIATYLTLKEWMSLLGNYHFCHCHKAYIINLRYVIGLKTDSIVLSSGEELLLSRKYKTEFKTKYFVSVGEQI
ncbi:MAG: LytTR family DNA-binding domain-containing protein [Erysipelotrichaceae bacterium]